MNRLDEPVFMVVSKPLLTEFGIHYRLESFGVLLTADSEAPYKISTDFHLLPNVAPKSSLLPI